MGWSLDGEEEYVAQWWTVVNGMAGQICQTESCVCQVAPQGVGTFKKKKGQEMAPAMNTPDARKAIKRCDIGTHK